MTRYYSLTTNRFKSIDRASLFNPTSRVSNNRSSLRPNNILIRYPTQRIPRTNNLNFPSPILSPNILAIARFRPNQAINTNIKNNINRRNNSPIPISINRHRLNTKIETFLTRSRPQPHQPKTRISRANHLSRPHPITQVTINLSHQNPNINNSNIRSHLSTNIRKRPRQRFRTTNRTNNDRLINNPNQVQANRRSQAHPHPKNPAETQPNTFK